MGVDAHSIPLSRALILAQVDGFRFDIMGHLMVPTMQKIQAALGALTLERDGVDGQGIYIYGEAWDFGEVLSYLILLASLCLLCTQQFVMLKSYLDLVLSWEPCVLCLDKDICISACIYTTA